MLNQRCTSGACADTAKNSGPIEAPSSQGTHSAGLTPFPFKIVTILSGATALNFWVFLLSSIVARTAIFFIMAALLWKLGPPIREFVEKRLGLMFVLFCILLFGGFAAVKFIL